MQHNHNLLEDTAQALLDQEVLEGEALRSRLQQAQLPLALHRWLKTDQRPTGTLLQETLTAQVH